LNHFLSKSNQRRSFFFITSSSNQQYHSRFSKLEQKKETIPLFSVSLLLSHLVIFFCFSDWSLSFVNESNLLTLKDGRGSRWEIAFCIYVHRVNAPCRGQKTMRKILHALLPLTELIQNSVGKEKRGREDGREDEAMRNLRNSEKHWKRLKNEGKW